MIHLKSIITKKLNELKDDSRYKAPCAVVFSNAPLALIQTGISAKITVLEWVLEQIKNTLEVQMEQERK